MLRGKEKRQGDITCGERIRVERKATKTWSQYNTHTTGRKAGETEPVKSSKVNCNCLKKDRRKCDCVMA